MKDCGTKKKKSDKLGNKLEVVLECILDALDVAIKDSSDTIPFVQVGFYCDDKGEEQIAREYIMKALPVQGYDIVDLGAKRSKTGRRDSDRYGKYQTIFTVSKKDYKGG